MRVPDPEPTNDDWCPLPFAPDIVIVRYRDGSTYGPIEAFKLDWDHPDIMEYKIIVRSHYHFKDSDHK